MPAVVVAGAFLFTLVYAIPGTVVMAAYTLMGRRLCAVKPPFDENSTAGSASSQQVGHRGKNQSNKDGSGQSPLICINS